MASEPKAGNVVLYEGDAASLALGVVVGVGKKVEVVRGDARRQHLVPRQVRGIFGSVSGRTDADHAAALGALEQRAEAELAAIDARTLWEMLGEEAEGLTLQQLADLAFKEGGSGAERIALFRLLESTTRFFKRRNERYLAKGAREVAEQEAQEARADTERRNRTDLYVLLNGALADPPNAAARAELAHPEQLPEPVREYLRVLRGYAIHGPEFERAKVAEDLLQGLDYKSGSPQETAFQLLVELGWFAPDENLALLRHAVPIAFDPGVEEAVAALPAFVVNGGAPARADLRDLVLVTIDDEDTRDIDDALSIERLSNGGYRLGVHIADVAAFVAPNATLDVAARGRGTTLYLPTGRITMFPQRLSEELASLVAGAERPALSFFAELSAGGELVREEIQRSLVRVARRLSYDSADAELTSGPLATLFELCSALRVRRVAAGASDIGGREVKVVVEEGGTVSVKRLEASGPSRRMVAETAILANQMAARFLMERRIPAVYRRQPPPDPLPPDAPPLPPEGPARENALRKRMKPSELGVVPGAHAGLGIPVYAQATSPIRRYLDLLLHHQISAALAGSTPPFTEAQVMACAAVAESRMREASLIERETREYWLLKYLGTRLREPLEATVLAELGKRVLVEIDDTLSRATLTPQRRYQAGDRLRVAVTSSYPRRGSLVLTEVSS